MQDFKKLNVWGKAHHLVLEIYHSTAKFPKDELFGLTSQIRRASVSIPANIAEGCGKEGKADFSRYLQIAIGSASELEYYLVLSYDLKLLDKENYEDLNDQTNEVKRTLINLVKKIKM
jgi:four helix bundle protein